MAGREARRSLLGAARDRDADRGKSMLAAVNSPVITEVMRLRRVAINSASDDNEPMIVL
jgi:hypothetical protein